MRATRNRLKAIRARLHRERITIARECPACGEWVSGDPGAFACGSHPAALAPLPGERIIRIERSYISGDSGG